MRVKSAVVPGSGKFRESGNWPGASVPSGCFGGTNTNQISGSFVEVAKRDPTFVQEYHTCAPEIGYPIFGWKVTDNPEVESTYFAVA